MVIDTLEKLRGLEDSWNRLSTACKNPLMSFSWFLSCAETFCADGKLRVMAVSKDGMLAGIAPLFLKEHNGLKWHEIIGASFLGEPTDLLYDSAGSARLLLQKILSSAYPTILHRVPKSSAVFRESGKLSFHGLCLSRTCARSAFVELKGSWDEYFATLSSRRKYDLKRARKRAEAFGPVAFEVANVSPESTGVLLKTVYDLEASGWKGKNGSAILKRPELLRFFDLYSRRASQEGKLRICLLRIGGAVAAAQIAVECGSRFWILKIAYDEKMSNCSPGILLTSESIRHAFNRGISVYEFLGSDEPWLDPWANGRHDYSAMALHPYTLQSAAALAKDIKKFALKRLKNLI